MQETLKVGVGGVRGIVGESFTPQLAVEFAQAFGALVGPGLVVVGRDTRPSGVMIERAIVAGLQSVGCRPVLVGIVPTPTIMMKTAQLQARGGIAITASHNPVMWNALKFVEGTGLFLNEVRAEQLLDLYHQQDVPAVAESDIASVMVEDLAVREHWQKVLGYVDTRKIKKRKFRVAVDLCNGVGALHTVAFLHDYLGCTVFPLHDGPTGVFEREPEPLPKNLGALCRKVREMSCDLGFAQDPDGDRLAVVNEKGEPIGEDLTLALAVEAVLAQHGRGPVVVNLATSKCVEDVARRYDCPVERTKVGEINVVEAMLRLGAVVGGENIGGVIVPAIHPCRDSYIAMALVLERLALTGSAVSAFQTGLPKYALIKEKVPVLIEDVAVTLRQLRQHFSEYRINLLDGILVDFGTGWLHVRRSNTEPVLRITVEATSEKEARQWVAEVRGIIAKDPG